MNIYIKETKNELGSAAAEKAAEIIRGAIRERGRAYITAATGASQFEFLDALVRIKDIDWEKTFFFHLDEYIGLPEAHPASFRKYLKERIIDVVHPREFYLINGEAADLAAECRRLNDLISHATIDVAFVGIGENGHLAFNDPPADFETEKPYLLVNLDENCRRQQLGEGWFGSLDQVPWQAISMSVRQILKARSILCIAPDRRKAEAVRNCLAAAIDPQYPASILQAHPDTHIYLDPDSASRLTGADLGFRMADR